MGSCTCMAESLGCASDSIANIINCLYANIKLKNFKKETKETGRLKTTEFFFTVLRA